MTPGAGAATGRPAGPSSAPRADDAKILNIGEVLDRLRADYPDVSLSKIRYLEGEGLVEPARTSANYRKYSAADVERLRYVLAAQRERYLPLRVIKDELADLERGVDPSTPGPRAVAAPEPRAGVDAFTGDTGEVRLSRRDLLTASGLDAGDLAELETFGLVAPARGGTYYDADALVIASAVARMAGFGIGARHLRAFRTTADREAGLIEQSVAPLARPRDPQAAVRAAEARDELAGLSVRLHAALLRTRLRSGAGN